MPGIGNYSYRWWFSPRLAFNLENSSRKDVFVIDPWANDLAAACNSRWFWASFGSNFSQALLPSQCWSTMRNTRNSPTCSSQDWFQENQQLNFGNVPLHWNPGRVAVWLRRHDLRPIHMWLCTSARPMRQDQDQIVGPGHTTQSIGRFKSALNKCHCCWNGAYWWFSVAKKCSSIRSFFLPWMLHPFRNKGLICIIYCNMGFWRKPMVNKPFIRPYFGWVG